MKVTTKLGDFDSEECISLPSSRSCQFSISILPPLWPTPGRHEDDFMLCCVYIFLRYNGKENGLIKINILRDPRVKRLLVSQSFPHSWNILYNVTILFT